MTDREIVIAATEKVMGWKRVPAQGKTVRYRRGEADYPLTVWNDDYHIHQMEGWNPLDSIADAWTLVERIRKIVPKQTQTQTYSVSVCQTGIPGNWDVSFTVNDGDWRTQASASADTAPRAITLAALRAAGVEV